VRLVDLGDDLGRLDRRGPEDDAVQPQIEELSRALGGPDAAAELEADLVRDVLDDRLDRVGVDALALERAVEVDEVERLGARLDPAFGGLHRVARTACQSPRSPPTSWTTSPSCTSTAGITSKEGKWLILRYSRGRRLNRSVRAVLEPSQTATALTPPR